MARFWEVGVDEPRVDAGKGMYGEVVREWALSRYGEDRAGHQREEGRYRKFYVGQLVSVEYGCEKNKVLSDCWHGIIPLTQSGLASQQCI